MGRRDEETEICDIDEYIEAYDMPASTLNGNLVYFAAHAKHIGLYPSVRAGGSLARVLSRYESGKGTLKFPLDEPLPLEPIEKVVRISVAKNAGKRRKVRGRVSTASVRAAAPARRRPGAPAAAPLRAR